MQDQSIIFILSQMCYDLNYLYLIYLFLWNCEMYLISQPTTNYQCFSLPIPAPPPPPFKHLIYTIDFCYLSFIILRSKDICLP